MILQEIVFKVFTMFDYCNCSIQNKQIKTILANSYILFFVTTKIKIQIKS